MNVITQGFSWRVEGTFDLDSNKGTYAEGFSVSGGFMGDIVFNGGKLFLGSDPFTQLTFSTPGKYGLFVGNQQYALQYA